MKRILVVAGLALVAATAARADHHPTIRFTNPSSASYAPGRLDIQSTPSIAKLDASGPQIFIQGQAGIAKILELHAQIDPNTGAFVGGVAGDDVIVAGNINDSYAGTLLRGELVSLEITDDPSDTDALIAVIHPTGGALLAHPDVAGHDVVLEAHLVSVRAAGAVAPTLTWDKGWQALSVSGNFHPQ